MYIRYEIQIIDSPKDGLNYRITDKYDDNRVATCFQKEHADLVCQALNYYDDRHSATSKAPIVGYVQDEFLPS